jgi:hypothetical protein
VKRFITSGLQMDLKRVKNDLEEKLSSESFAGEENEKVTHFSASHTPRTNKLHHFYIAASLVL